MAALDINLQPDTGNSYKSLTISNSSKSFPSNLSSFPFWMSFNFYQYQMPDYITQQMNKKLVGVGGAIRLPLPNSMIDANHVEYSAEGIGLAGAAAIQAVNTIENVNVNTLSSTLLGAAGVAGALAGAGIVNKIGNSTAVRAALATQGVALNPFLTVLFKSPAFKRHTLSWKLAPSNQNESRVLNYIITAFRGNMLPGQTQALGGALLTYPNIVQVSVNSSSEEYFKYSFKPAVITDCSINFTASGQPSFFGSTKAPTEVELRLELMEIEYWLSSDYEIGENQTAIDFTKLINPPLYGP
jgi:hypothetical protein